MQWGNEPRGIALVLGASALLGLADGRAGANASRRVERRHH